MCNHCTQDYLQNTYTLSYQAVKIYHSICLCTGTFEILCKSKIVAQPQVDPVLVVVIVFVVMVSLWSTCICTEVGQLQQVAVISCSGLVLSSKSCCTSSCLISSRRLCRNLLVAYFLSDTSFILLTLVLVEHSRCSV